MSDHTANLLNAEEAVQELQSELQRLLREVGGYATARQTLEQTQEQLLGLARRHDQLVGNTAGIIARLGEIGTPQLLERLDQLLERQGAVAQSIEQGQVTLAQRLEASDAQQAKVASDLSARLEQLESALVKGQGGLKRLVIVAIVLALVAVVMAIPAVQRLMGG